MEGRRKFLYLAGLACTSIIALRLISWNTFWRGPIGSMPSQVHLALAEESTSMVFIPNYLRRDLMIN